MVSGLPRWGPVPGEGPDASGEQEAVRLRVEGLGLGFEGVDGYLGFMSTHTYVGL